MITVYLFKCSIPGSTRLAGEIHEDGQHQATCYAGAQAHIGKLVGAIIKNCARLTGNKKPNMIFKLGLPPARTTSWVDKRQAHSFPEACRIYSFLRKQGFHAVQPLR